jgi:regulator of replication initiation timing
VALKNVHAAAQACCDHLNALGYDESPTETEATASSKKADDGVDVTKLAGELDVLKASIGKLESENTALKSEVETLKKQPAHGKALLKAVSKGADTLTPVEPVNKAEEPDTLLKGEALALHQIKSIYQQAGTVRVN